MFENLSSPQLDELYQTAMAFRADSREGKIDLGVGVYRDENGASPVMRCVREAEERLAQINDSKAYLPLAGEPGFLGAMTDLLFGKAQPSQVVAVQCVGGTGGIRLALEVAQAANPSVTAHIGLPSWPNHQGICDRLGISIAPYNYLNSDQGDASLTNAHAAIDGAKAGDVFIFHGPCHNPTGMDLPSDQVLELIDHAAEKGVIALIDAAYYGLGNDLDDDLNLLRAMVDRSRECFLIMSGSKAFGLYRDRIGILFAKGADADAAARVQANAQVLARVNYSAPAAHGAQVIGTILTDDVLRQYWREELDTMRTRLSQLRAHIKSISDEHAALHAIWNTKGVFAMLPMDQSMTDKLARDYAIYMPSTGRINLAGLSTSTAYTFVSAVNDLVPN